MKRSAALRSLSRDHHHALVVAQRLRRADEADAAEAAVAFLEFWSRDGRTHFRVEEEVLLPLWALLGRIDDRAAARLSREHLEIRWRAARLEETGGGSRQELRDLGDRLAAHVRFEERGLFPLIEADLGPECLERLARVVAEAEAGA